MIAETQKLEDMYMNKGTMPFVEHVEKSKNGSIESIMKLYKDGSLSITNLQKKEQATHVFENNAETREEIAFAVNDPVMTCAFASDLKFRQIWGWFKSLALDLAIGDPCKGHTRAQERIRYLAESYGTSLPVLEYTK